VIPLEESDPEQIVRFVQSEVKQYASFSGRATVSDFRVLAPATPNAPGKLLVSAADHEGAAALVGTCRNAGMPSTAVESGVTACVRTFTEMRKCRSGGRTLLVLRKDGTLTFCVLHRGILDYIRTKTIATADAEARSVGNWVADECEGVMEFYSIESMAASGGWDVVVIDDTDDALSEEAQRTIKERLAKDGVEFWTRTQWPTGLALDEHLEEGPSIAGVGLAIRLLQENEHRASVNLLPPEEHRAMATRRKVLLAANATAALILAIVLVGGGFGWMTEHVNRNAADLRQAAMTRGDRPLAAAVSTLATLEQRVSAVSAELDCLKRVSESRPQVNWVRLLGDIHDAIPQALSITEMSLEDASCMRVEGVSESYEGVDMFVEALNHSDYIRQATLLRKARSTTDPANVQYAVRCFLLPREIR
jgi:Tfp pilus assembly protein PilN